MSNGDPDAVTDPLSRAQDAFRHEGFGQPTFEDGIDTTDDWRTQLTKGCKLIEVTNTLQEQNGYYIAMIELSFAVIERSLEAYLLAMTGDDLNDFQDHTYVYQRADESGLFTADTAEELRDLYESNRTDSYYAGQHPTGEQAAAMIDLSRGVHEYVDSLIRGESACNCP